MENVFSRDLAGADRIGQVAAIRRVEQPDGLSQLARADSPGIASPRVSTICACGLRGGPPDVFDPAG
jgi:hypothetical protein